MDFQALYHPYVGNRLNAAEQSRFDFPQRTLAGQPLGILKTGGTEKHDVLSRTEPAHLPSPTRDNISVVATNLSMPTIKSSPQNDTSSNGSPGKRDQEAYIERLRQQAEQRQYQLALSEAQLQQYQQRHAHPSAQATSNSLSLNQFSQAMHLSGTSGRVPVPGAGSDSNGRAGVTLNLDAEMNAARRIHQAELARKIAQDAAREPIPEGHAILLHQPQYLHLSNKNSQLSSHANQELFDNNMNASNSATGRNASSVLVGEGEIPALTLEQKKIQQVRYVQQMQEALQQQRFAQSQAYQETNILKPPRQRPSSPPVPIPGENILNNLGLKDDPRNKAQRVEQARQILDEQNELIRQYKNVKQAAQPMLLRTSDEYGLMSGRTGLSKSNTPSPNKVNAYMGGMQQGSVLGEDLSLTHGAYASSLNGGIALSPLSNSHADNFLVNQSIATDFSEQSSAPGFGYQRKITSSTRNAVPDRDPKSYFPSPAVREAHARAAAAQDQRNDGTNTTKELSISEENREKRKEQQKLYHQALDSDRQVKPPDASLAKISLHHIPQKAANNRHEMLSMFSPVKPGPSIIDQVGQHDATLKDPMKKREMHETYRGQLQAAQQAVLPVGALHPRVPLSAQQQQVAQRHATQAKPFNDHITSYQQAEERRSRDNNSLPITGNSAYSGYTRSGFYATDPMYQDMRAQDAEKRKEFYEIAQQENAQEPIYSPRTMMYRRKNMLADGGSEEEKYGSSQPYGLLAEAVSSNDDTLTEKGIAHGLKKMAVQQRVAQLEQDKINSIKARATPQERVALKQYTPRTKDEIEKEILANTAPGGLPMFNQYDWNQNALDFTWNSDQNPDRVGGMNSGRHFPLPHATHHMYFGQGQMGPGDIAALASARAPNRTQGQEASDRYLLLAENQSQNVSLSMSPLELDMAKVQQMKNQAAYKEGLLSDRSLRFQQQQQQQMQQQQSNRIPQLHITQPIPVHNPNLHNPQYGGAGLDDISGVTSLANGRQPQVPAKAPVQRSNAYNPDSHRMVGGQMTIAGNSRASALQAPVTISPQKVGFVMSSHR